jgi:hypothetical protein
MATKQDAAVNAANTLIGFLASLKNLRISVNDFVTAYNSEGYNTTWANLKTCAQNVDGTLGTADGTPNVANPIDTRVSGQALTKAVSQTVLVNAVNLCKQLQNLLTNAAVTQGNYNQTIDDVAS